MNDRTTPDRTPPRPRSSLLERAAEIYHYDGGTPSYPPIVEAEPRPLARRTPLAAPEPPEVAEPAPRPEALAPLVPVVPSQPVPQPVVEERAPVPVPVPVSEQPVLRHGLTPEPEVSPVPEAPAAPVTLPVEESATAKVADPPVVPEMPAPVVPEPVASEPVVPAPVPVVPVPAVPVAPEAEPVPEPVAARAPAVAAPVEPAAVPMHPPRRRAAIDRARLRELGMIVPGAAVTPLAEEFRLVKRQLLLTVRAVAGSDADHARMILVTSARANEGKTFCALNLALSMAAEQDWEILLVDADFAKPDVLDRLGIAEGPGLLDALDGGVADVEQCIIETDVPNLSILPAGARTSSDTELLASDKARALLDTLAANPRRIVLFDSPPVLAASPASVLALQVGQVMLVVRADMTTESDLREAVPMLDACEHIQLVLNSVSYQPGGRRFGDYYEESGQ